MRVIELAHATWDEIRELDRARAIAVLPVGAVEAHGPHLPLTTDGIIAEAMARSGAARLAARGHPVVLLPPLTYTAAPFAAGFPGTLSVTGPTVTALIVDIARSLGAQQIPILALANAHLDPAHLLSLAAAVAVAEEQRPPRVVFPDISKKPWASRLSDEFKSGACHAGRFESSIVMAARPELVREDIRRGLAANPASLSHAIRDGKQSFEEAGGPRAYFGVPAEASVAEGERTIDTLGQILAEAVLTVVGEGP